MLPRTTLKKHSLILIALLLPSVLFMSIKATNPLGWDNWGFGSAQTILTVRYWARDGFIHHKLLFIPSGYYRHIEFIDLPEFRFLANGLKTGGLIGQRLYYTHYPSGYLIPFGLLAKLGANDRVWFRLLAIGMSTLAVVFLYGFIYTLTRRNQWIASVSTLYYITSTTFLGYADSLANMPIDDLLKYAILFCSIYSERTKKYVWPLFFILCSSSYDSTLFLLLWLCGSHLFTTRKLSIRYYAAIVSAPIAAFLVQVAQNWWYLGFHDMVYDFMGAFIYRASEIPPALASYPHAVQKIAASLSTIGYLTDMRTRTVLPLIIIMLALLYTKPLSHRLLMYYVYILGAAGILYGFLVPIAGTFGYQGRQIAPAFLVLIGYATYTTILWLWRRQHLARAVPLVLILVVVWTAHIWGTKSYIQQWPNAIVPETQIKMWQSLARDTDVDTILVGDQKKIGTGFELFFAQAYTDRLMLPFANFSTAEYYAKKIKTVVPPSTKLLLVR